MKLFLILLILIISGAGYFAVQQARNPKEEPVKGNALEKYDLVRVSTPRPGTFVENPVLVEGEARGYWFFEADFPVRVLDVTGQELGIGIAHALDEWMTEEFVPFRASVQFMEPFSKEGVVVLEKDNPSGLQEHADELRIPVRFAE